MKILSIRNASQTDCFQNILLSKTLHKNRHISQATDQTAVSLTVVLSLHTIKVPMVADKVFLTKGVGLPGRKIGRGVV